MKEKCPRNKEGRRITHWVDEHIIEELSTGTQYLGRATPDRRPQGAEMGHIFCFLASPVPIWVKLRPNLSIRRLSS